jgi:importin subunit beta-1
VLSADDKAQIGSLQGLLFATLHYVFDTCEVAEAQSIADSAMQYILQVLATKSGAAEEAFMCCGKIINKLEGTFDRYLEHLMPLLLHGMGNFAEHEVCAAAVGCCGDLCRAVEAKLLPYCDAIIQGLLVALENPDLKRDVKPPMLGLFGDIALATGAGFQRYLAPPSRAMVMLYQASKTTVPADNDDLMEYLNDLHEGVVEAYTGVVNGLADASVCAVLLQVDVGGVNAVAGVAEFLGKLGAFPSDDEVVRGAVGLAGDIAKALGSAAAPYLTVPVMTPLLARLRELAEDDEDDDQEKSQETLRYAEGHLAAAHAK